jgi:nucleotide-binding universal stress UspA family protein
MDKVPHPIESAEAPATVLLEQVVRLGAGLIVTGAHGEPALPEVFLESGSRTVLKESRLPVFLAC